MAEEQKNDEYADVDEKNVYFNLSSDKEAMIRKNKSMHYLKVENN